MSTITETSQKKVLKVKDNNVETKKSQFQQDFEKGIPLEVAKQKLLTKVKELWSK
jgi:hypothetical protein